MPHTECHLFSATRTMAGSASAWHHWHTQEWCPTFSAFTGHPCANVGHTTPSTGKNTLCEPQLKYQVLWIATTSFIAHLKSHIGATKQQLCVQCSHQCGFLRLGQLTLSSSVSESSYSQARSLDIKIPTIENVLACSWLLPWICITTPKKVESNAWRYSVLSALLDASRLIWCWGWDDQQWERQYGQYKNDLLCPYLIARSPNKDVDEDVEVFGPNHEPGNHRDNPSKYNAGSMLCTFPYRTLWLPNWAIINASASL